MSATDEPSPGPRPTAPRLDLDAVEPEVRVALEAAVAGEAVTVHRSGQVIGTLDFHSSVLEGVVVERPPEPAPTESVPDGATVVATAMRLSEAARDRLADGLGEGYVVLDLHDAPPTADVLLTHPVSPQLLGILRQQFPEARVVVTEIEDDELDVHLPGPVSRLLDAGASAYLPPRPVAELAAGVHAYLTRAAGPALESGAPGPSVRPPRTLGR